MDISNTCKNDRGRREKEGGSGGNETKSSILRSGQQSQRIDGSNQIPGFCIEQRLFLFRGRYWRACV